MAAGFVLGEVLGLQNQAAVTIVLFGGGTAVCLTLPRVLSRVCGSRTAGRGGHDAESGGHGTEGGRCGVSSLWLWLLPVVILTGFFRASWVKNAGDRELGLALDQKEASVSGRVCNVTRREEGKYLLELKNCRMEQPGEDGEKETLGKLMVYLDWEGTGLPGIGNQVLVTGTFHGFSSPRVPGEFDYQLYYRSQGVHYRMFGERLKILDGRYNRYLNGLAGLRRRAAEILENTADPEEAGIYQAAILGDKTGLDPEIQKLYQKNGIAHLLAVSGLHLSLVSAAAYGSLRRLGAGYKTAGVLGGLVLISYAVFTGASSSVIRALIMGLCGFLAAALGRTYDLMSAWSLAALWILWDSPYLICQAGVQLSFGALAGIGWLAPELAKKEEHVLLQTLRVSISMQLVTLPMLLYHFFQYPLYGIILNLVTVPLMGGVIASGTAGIFLGAGNPGAGRFMLGTGHWILYWYELCCRFFEQLPFYLLTPGRPEPWKIGIYYGGLLAAVWLGAKKTDRGEVTGRKWRHGVLILLVFFLMVPAPVRGMEVWFLDVGQGDGICIRTENQTILVDGGSTDQKKLGEGRLEPFLKSRGCTTVDCAFVSHGDMDHISGLMYLMEDSDIAVQNLVLPAVGKGDPVYDRLEELAQKQGGQVIWMEQGQKVQTGELSISCLYPDEEAARSDDRNEDSLVLRVDYENFHLLLTGDMSGTGEAALLKQLPEGSLSDVQVLKVAHHGSGYSSTPEWLDQVQPVWAVISCGEGNRYGHPHEEVIRNLKERKIKTFLTTESGTVVLYTDGKKISWEEYCGSDRISHLWFFTYSRTIIA